MGVQLALAETTYCIAVLMEQTDEVLLKAEHLVAVIVGQVLVQYDPLPKE